jgi:WD40 repeat protein
MQTFIRLSTGFWLLALAPLSVLGQPAPKLVRLEHEGTRINVAFSPDGKTLATGGQDNHIRLWDVATGKLQRAIKAHNAPAGVSRLAYCPDGKLLASAGWFGGGTVKLWDVGTGREVQLIGKDDGGVGVLVISPDGQFLAWGDSANAKVRLHDLKADREARSVSARGAVDSAAFSPDSSLLATAHGGGTVHLWDVATGKPIREITAGQCVATGSQAVAFSHDGKILATASAKLRLWKVDTGEEIVSLGPANESPFCVAFSPDGRFLACGTMSGSLRLWNAATQKEICSWDEPAASVAFSKDGRWLAFGSRTNRGGACLVEVGTLVK